MLHTCARVGEAARAIAMIFLPMLIYKHYFDIVCSKIISTIHYYCNTYNVSAFQALMITALPDPWRHLRWPKHMSRQAAES